MSWMRCQVDTVEDYMGVLTARAAALGATTRGARVTLYDHADLGSSALTALESGARQPTEAEQLALESVGQRLGWSTPEGALATLPAGGGA